MFQQRTGTPLPHTYSSLTVQSREPTMSSTFPNSVTAPLASSRDQDGHILQPTVSATRKLNLYMPPPNLSDEEISARIDDYYFLMRNTGSRTGWSVAQGIMTIAPCVKYRNKVRFITNFNCQKSTRLLKTLLQRTKEILSPVRTFSNRNGTSSDVIWVALNQKNTRQLPKFDFNAKYQAYSQTDGTIKILPTVCSSLFCWSY